MSDVWIRLPQHKWPKSWNTLRIRCSSWTKLIRTPTRRTLVGKTFRKKSIDGTLLEKVPNWECLFVHRKQKLFLSVYVDDIKMARKKQNLAPMWNKLMKNVDIDEPHFFLIVCTCVARNESANQIKKSLNNVGRCFESRFLQEEQKITGVAKTSRTNRSVVLRHGGTCSQMRWAILRSGKQESGAIVQSFMPLPGWLSTQAGSTRISWRIVKRLFKIVLKCLYLARIGRPDILWSVNKLAACDRRLARLISYIHHTNDFRRVVVWETRHSIADWVCIKTQTLLEIVRTRNQPQGESFVFSEAEQLFQSVGCSRNKLLSRTAPQSLRWLRMDGLPALDLWDMLIEVLHSTNNNAQPKHTSHQETGAVLDFKYETQHVKRRQKVEHLSEVDYVPTNTHSSQSESQLYNFEDNEAVIKMIIEGRSPTMRHVSRTHRVALVWLFDRINLHPNPHQICWYQDPICGHVNKRKFNKW